jgi:iron transport multicopper oxidase
LIDVNGTTTLVPLEPVPALNATRATPVTASFQNTADGQFLAFMNNTSWEPLNGTTTLLAVHQNPTGFAPDGVGIASGDQLLLTADSIQVIDLQVVRVLVRIYLARSLTCA